MSLSKPLIGAILLAALSYGDVYASSRRVRMPAMPTGRNMLSGRSAGMSASSVPTLFFEDFEGSMDFEVEKQADILPAMGWTLIPDASAGCFETYFLKGLNAYSGRYYMYAPYNEKARCDNWAVIPALTLEEGETYRVGVFVNAPGYQTVTEEFRLMVGRAPTSSSLDVCVVDATGKNSILTEQDEWREVAGRFTPQETGMYYIGFHHCSRKDGDFVSFDDIRVSPVPQTGGEVSFTRPPYFGYTMVPASWPLSVPLMVDYSVRNIGAKALEGASVRISVSAPSEAGFRRDVSLPAMAWDETQTGGCRFDEVADGSVSGPFECNMTLHDAAGDKVVEVSASDIVSPDHDGLWLARDNGLIAGTMSLGIFNGYKTSARIGMRFDVPSATLADAVRFVLLGGYSTSRTVIARLYHINKKGVVYEYAASRREDLDTDPSGYTEYTLTFPSEIELEPGSYILSLDEADGEALGLALTSNYTGKNLAFTIDGEEWRVLEGTPYLRLRTTDVSGLPDMGDGEAFSVIEVGGAFVIDGVVGSPTSMAVYAPSGNKIADFMITPSDTTVAHTLSPGVYVVVAGTKAFKVVVRG